MSPGKISKFEKPTGSVEAPSSQNPSNQEMKPTRQSARLLKKAAPQDSDLHIGEDGQKDFHNTAFQNVKRVFRSCVGKITKKPTKKKRTKKASDSQTAKKEQQMFENELLSTIEDQVWNPVFHEAVPSTPTINNNNTRKSDETLPFNPASEFQPPFHYQHDLAGEFYHAETVFDAIDSHALQLNPAREFGSPKSLGNVAQIKELGNTSEVGSPDPFARDQQIDPALEFGSTPPPAHVQPLDPAPDFCFPAPSTHVPNFYSAFEFGSPAPSTHDQQFHPALEAGSPPSIDYAQPYSPSFIFGSPASFTHVSNIAPAIEFGSPAPSAHVPNFNSAVEFGSPAPFDYTHPKDYRLGSVSPEGFQYSQLHKDATGTASIAQVQLVDPRLQEESLLDFQDQAYKPVTGTLFPAIIDQTCIHPESSFPIPSTQAAQYVYYNPQTDMSTTSAHEQTNHASATSSPATFHHHVGKDNDSLHRDCIVGHPLNGYGLPTITHQHSHYNGHHAGNIKNENASYPASFHCRKPLGKSSGTFNSLRMIASSGLTDELTTYNNDTGVNPVMINSNGIKMEPPPMAPFYPTGRLSLAEKLEVPQGQQGIAHNEDNANNWGHGNADSVHFASQPLTVPVPEHETKAESEPTGSVTERRTVKCSVEAAETGLWHWAMSRYGLYRPRGMIQVLGNGTMQWREHARARWCNAVSHTSIRGQLLAECAKLGQYTHPREKGATAEDITAFHPDQKDWAFDQRHLRPDILHQYEKRGYRDPLYPVQIWLHHGAVVLDHQNHPILDFKNMPKTISSQVEGGLQEAITRQDSRIDVSDFRARMMFDPKGLGRLSSPCPSAISMRRSRFRWRAGYLSWTNRMGSQDIKKYLDSILPAHCKAANSTKDFRELKDHEVKRMTLENRGKHLNRAGLRKLSPAARERSDRVFRRGLRKAEIRDGIAVEESGEEEDYNDDEEMADSSTEAKPPARVDATIEVNPRQPPVAGPRRWMQDMSEEELREHRKRVLQIFAPQCESWEDLDGLQKFTVDSWADLEAVGIITYGDGKKPVPDYGVIRELIKHILDGKRVSEYYLFREYDENAARLLG